jgi:uncharacterized protein YjbJ (UPF0337 family)
MALLRRNDADAPLEQRSTKTLTKQLAEARKELRELDALDSKTVVREGKADEVLGQTRQALATVKTLREERSRRDAEGRALHSRSLRSQDPVRRALEWAARQLGGELKLSAGRLTDEEGKELRDLVDRFEHLTDAERQRLERIVGAGAGTPTCSSSGASRRRRGRRSPRWRRPSGGRRRPAIPAPARWLPRCSRTEVSSTTTATS